MGMYKINRNIAIIKPNQPFLSWLKSLPDWDLDITEKDLGRDCTAVLIPEAEGEVDARRYIESLYKELFEVELVFWHRDKSIWPKRRTLKLFRKWFEIEYHSMVIDVTGEVVEKEELIWPPTPEAQDNRRL